jgi:hypothetical protein
MALAGISIVAVGGYALFVQLSANALMPAAATSEAGREPAAIVATGATEEGSASVSAAPQETSGRTDVVALSTARTASGREGPPRGYTPKSATAYAVRSILLDRLRTFTHAFAELAEVKHPHRARRSIRSSSPQSRTN